MNKVKKQKGFTLIELLVVIAIIGILAAIVLVNVNSARNKAKDAGVKSNLGNMPLIATDYALDNGSLYLSGEDNFCTDERSVKIGDAVVDSEGEGSYYCATNIQGDAWMVCGKIGEVVGEVSTAWCIDHYGNKSRVSFFDYCSAWVGGLQGGNNEGIDFNCLFGAI